MSSIAQTDAVLLERLRRRDPAVLGEIVREHARPLFRAAMGMGFREQEAEDLAQDVFLSFLETLDRFEGRSQVRTWLFGILHNKIRERRRERMAEERNDPIDEVFEARFDASGKWARPPAGIERLLESKEAGLAIRACMDGLPETQREVFVLREIQGLETAEVCKILGVSVTNLGVLMHRARARLRECLEALGWSKES